MLPPWFHALVLFTVASIALAGPRYSSRIVETKSGAIRGVILELSSRHLEPVEVFFGIPYAAPPTGVLRYRPPSPPLTWSGTRLADTFGAVCPQRAPDVSNRTAALLNMPRGRYLHLKRLVPLLVNQSEDCLFLNLYVPGSGNRGVEAPYAVMFYVHGESYEWNSGNAYDGSVLASYSHVIVVTCNFRLGVLGFLRTRTGPDAVDRSGGNLALRDILLALEWVRSNVEAFGGDPTRVTVLGHDTGAALVNLLLISTAAKGLFQRAVLLSGSALSPWAIIQQPNNLRVAVANQLGCPIKTPPDATAAATSTTTPVDVDDDDIAPCLRTKSLSSLLDVRIDAPRFLPRFGPSLPVDPLTGDPTYAMEHANEAFVSCQLMLGTSTTESYLDFNANDIQYGFEEDQRNRVLRTYVRNAYVYHLNEIFSTVRNEYTDWDKPIQHPINIRDSTMEALSDGHTVAPLMRVGHLHARRGAKTYLFHFGYQTKDSEYPQRLGTVRGEDVTYIFGLPLVGGLPYFPQNFTRQDMGVAEAVLNFLANFAKTGDPNEPRVSLQKTDYGTVKEKTRYKGLHWETYETGTQLYLSIALKPKMKSHYRGHKMSVWLNLIPQLHQPGDDDVSMRHHHFHEREEHYFAGSVRAESFTRLPPPLRPVDATSDLHGAPIHHSSVAECLPNVTSEEDLLRAVEEGVDDDEAGLLQRLATRHYYSYTAALGVTVGVGCLLLVLNMLIFAGIYYQRDRRRNTTSSGSTSSASSEGIPMSQRPQPPQTVAATAASSQSPASGAHVIKVHEPPPCYTTVTKSPSIPEPPPPPRQSAPVEKRGGTGPPPPQRTSSNCGTIKKRVQIQEISV